MVLERLEFEVLEGAEADDDLLIWPYTQYWASNDTYPGDRFSESVKDLSFFLAMNVLYAI